jgi:UDP-2,3-diacylglucosamine hydrolase
LLLIQFLIMFETSISVMIYFASDFHLGVPSFETSLVREKKICRWLDAIKNNATEIYLLGDCFDFWFEYKDVVPKGSVRLLGKIAELTDQEIKITFFKGNHDMWTFGYLEKELGIQMITNELVIKRNNKTFFLHHGDGIGPGDRGYKLIKKIFRHPFSIALFGFLHPRLGAGLAKYLSRKSRLGKGDSDKTYLGDDKEFTTLFCKEMLKKQHYDYFIFGHRHLPLNIQLNEKSQYINLGEWVHDFTYAVFDGTHIELKTFND